MIIDIIDIIVDIIIIIIIIIDIIIIIIIGRWIYGMGEEKIPKHRYMGKNLRERERDIG